MSFPESFSRTRVFIIAKTYPHPSRKYEEIVCTGGITEDGQLVRLYPIPFRLLSDDKRFPLYSWVSVGIRKNRKDSRKESYHPDLSSLRIERTISHKGSGWQERRQIIAPLEIDSVEQLTDAYERDKTSIGILRPVDPEPEAVRTDVEWDDKAKAAIQQLSLFKGLTRVVEKIPWRFKVRYRCRDKRCKGHNQTLRDWGAYQLYRRQMQKFRDEERAKNDVIDYFRDRVFSNKREPFFILGSIHPYKSFIIGGVFWPPRLD